ncbi:MAG: pyrroloquinoline quinone biosynthesis peptide chaperone PqqD [Gammaproteobacteria bacterium]|nr:pyrroloquinoline quinone biosynthesis peptide chaperone PqqD [Gammaproteobacteria bacterium]
MSNQTDIPHFNPMFRLQWEQAQDCYVLLFPEGMVKLNGAAGEIMKLVNGKNSIEKITELLLKQFPDGQGINDDVNEFLIVAAEKKWLYYEQ